MKRYSNIKEFYHFMDEDIFEKASIETSKLIEEGDLDFIFSEVNGEQYIEFKNSHSFLVYPSENSDELINNIIKTTKAKLEVVKLIKKHIAESSKEEREVLGIYEEDDEND